MGRGEVRDVRDVLTAGSIFLFWRGLDPRVEQLAPLNGAILEQAPTLPICVAHVDTMVRAAARQGRENWAAEAFAQSLERPRITDPASHQGQSIGNAGRLRQRAP